MRVTAFRIFSREVQREANMKPRFDPGLIKAGFDVKKYADLSLVQEAARRLQ